jgi:hypothetical protein
MINYGLILITNYADKQWSLDGNSYDGLDWADSSPKPTQAELEALEIPTETAQSKLACKNKAKSLLAASDWSVLPDVGLTNKSDFESYRATLRNLALNPVENPTFPTEPTPVWS